MKKLLVLTAFTSASILLAGCNSAPKEDAPAEPAATETAAPEAMAARATAGGGLAWFFFTFDLAHGPGYGEIGGGGLCFSSAVGGGVRRVGAAPPPPPGTPADKGRPAQPSSAARK